MTEKEKMLAGMLYRVEPGSELLGEQARAKELCRRYNALPFGEETEGERESLIRQIIGKAGKNICVQPSFWCDYGSHITVGDDFYVNHNCVMLDVAPITFGDRVFIAPNCGFYTAGHPINREVRNSGLEYGRPITVGSDVWIGGNVVVLPGVTIGDNVVIGAGSVVTKSIPDHAIAGGVPCQILKWNPPLSHQTEQDGDCPAILEYGAAGTEIMEGLSFTERALGDAQNEVSTWLDGPGLS